MQIIFDLFNLMFFDPIVNLLIFVYRVLEASSIPGALGFSIIVLTLLVKAVLWPFMAQQLKLSKKMGDLKPHLTELKKKHGDDKQAYAKAQMDLYKEHGINPAGGCLPTLATIVVTLALYQVIAAIFDPGQGLERINQSLYFPDWKLTRVPDQHFFGIDLAAKPADFMKYGWYLILLPVVTAMVTFIQSKMMIPAPLKEYPSDSPKEKKEKEGMEEAMSAMQGQMVFLMPLMIGYFAFTFPAGLSIYWITFTILNIYQQYRISGWGGMTSLLNRAKIIK